MTIGKTSYSLFLWLAIASLSPLNGQFLKRPEAGVIQEIEDCLDPHHPYPNPQARADALRRAVGDLFGFDSDAALAVLTRVVGDCSVGLKQRQIVVGNLAEMVAHAPAEKPFTSGEEAIIKITRDRELDGSIRMAGIEGLGKVFRSNASVVASQALNGLASQPEAEKELAAAAAKALAEAANENPSMVDRFRKHELPIVREGAEREFKRLRGLDPEMPYQDIYSLERWRKHQLGKFKFDLSSAIDSVAANAANSYQRDHFVKGSMAIWEHLTNLQKMNLRETAVEVLAEFYDASRRSRAATNAVARYSDAAEAAKALPPIEWTEVSYRVNRQTGAVVEEESTDHSFDLGGLASVIMGSAAAIEIVHANEAKRQAQAHSNFLKGLSADTLSDTKLRLVKKMEQDDRVRGLRGDGSLDPKVVLHRMKAIQEKKEQEGQFVKSNAKALQTLMISMGKELQRRQEIADKMYKQANTKPQFAALDKQLKALDKKLLGMRVEIMKLCVPPAVRASAGK